MPFSGGWQKTVTIRFQLTDVVNIANSWIIFLLKMEILLPCMFLFIAYG